MTSSPQATCYPTRRRVSAVALACALIATTAVFGAIAMLVDRATSTAWLHADQAVLIAHCDAKTASTERRACVQAALAWRDQPSRLAVAKP